MRSHLRPQKRKREFVKQPKRRFEKKSVRCDDRKTLSSQLSFGACFHLKELVNLSAVSGVILMLLANVKVQFHRVLEVADVGGIVKLQRFGQLVEMRFEPVAHLFYFLVCKMFFVFHRDEDAESGGGSEICLRRIVIKPNQTGQS